MHFGRWGKEDYVRPVSKVKGLRKAELHEPLTTEEHIRLLKVYPAGWPNQLITDEDAKDRDPMVRCDSYQISLDRLKTDGLPLYCALSYEWGKGRPCRVINCGAKMRKIQSNLFDALVWIRRVDKPMLLWVDRLCIRQDDDVEKSAQVQRMYKIYEQAHVMHWLGHHNGLDDAEAMLRVAERLNCLCSGVKELDKPARDVIMQRWQQMGHSVDKVKSVPWVAMLRVLSRPYFRRLWIFQECVFGKSHECRIGLYDFDMLLLVAVEWVSYSILGGALDVIFWKELGTEEANELILDYPRLQTAVISSRNPWINQPYEIAEWHQLSECSDPRDHVYGLASLFHSPRPYPVDYTLRVQRVYTDFVVNCIRTTGDLAVLNAGSRRSELRAKEQRLHVTNMKYSRTLTPDLPSWCPDWAGPKTSQNPYYFRDFSASRHRHVSLVRLTDGTISLRGIQLDKVAACSKQLSTYPPGNHLRHLQDIRSAESIALRLRQYLLPSKLWKTYLDVLTAGEALNEREDLRRWLQHVPIRDQRSVGLKMLGSVWLAKCSKQIFELAHPAVPRSLSQETISVTKAVREVIWIATHRRRVFSTDNGLLGSGQEGIHVGDVVCVLYGGCAPFILRQVSNQGHYKLIGEAYVHGIMHGEAIDAGYEEKDFLLI